MIQNACISRDRLHDFSLGFLDDEESSRISQHLEECENCDETLAGLDEATDSLLRHIRQPSAASQYEGDGEFQIALNRVSELDLDNDASTSSTRHSAIPVEQTLRDYQLGNVIGFGGMGTVYQGTHTRLNMPVAVKVLPQRRMRDMAAVTRFQREMRAIGKLDHPSIVRATDAGEVDGTHYLVMELIEGVDLGRLIKSRGPVDIANSCEMIRQAAIGLQYAHEIGIVHRDIKPSNLMLNERGQIKLLDLGLALLGGVDSPVDELTTIGQLMGTVDYMAPEQCGDSHEVTSRADVYALGATLYKLLSGKAPYSGPKYKTALQKLRAVGNDPIERIENRCDEIPIDLANAVHRALSADPNDRFATVQEFADAITPFVEGHDPAQLCSQAKLECDANREAEFDDLSRADKDFVSRLQVSSPPQLEKKLEPTALAAGKSDNTSWRRWLVAVSAAAILFLAGIVIYLETSKGTLVIESAADVEVTIRKGDKVHDSLQLKQGKNSIRLSAGEYEIELTGESDSLVVDEGNFILKRGEKVVARISQSNARSTAESPAGLTKHAAVDSRKVTLPVYQGQTIVRWIATVNEVTPSVARRRRAEPAFAFLGNDPTSESYILQAMEDVYSEAKIELSDERIGQLADRIVLFAGEKFQAKAMTCLFELAETRPAYTGSLEESGLNGSRPYSKPYFLAAAAINLPGINVEILSRCFDELQNESPSRRFLAAYLLWGRTLPPKTTETKEFFTIHRSEFVERLLKVTRDENMLSVHFAFGVLDQIDSDSKTLQDRQIEALDSDKPNVVQEGLRWLVWRDPTNERLRKRLEQFARSGNAGEILTALNLPAFLENHHLGASNSAEPLSQTEEFAVAESVVRILDLLKDPNWGNDVIITNEAFGTYLTSFARRDWNSHVFRVPDRSAREFAMFLLAPRVRAISDDELRKQALELLKKETNSKEQNRSKTASQVIESIKSSETDEQLGNGTSAEDMKKMMEEAGYTAASEVTAIDSADEPKSTGNKPLYKGAPLSEWIGDLDAGPMVEVRRTIPQDTASINHNEKLKAALQAIKVLRVEDEYREEILAAIRKWKSIAERERSGDQLGWAATVIGTLAGKKYSNEAIDAIYEMASKLPVYQLKEEKPQFEVFMEDASLALDQVDSAKLIERMVAEFAEGSTVSRMFTLAMLHAEDVEFPSRMSNHSKKLVSYFHKHRELVIEALLASSHDENGTVANRSAAIVVELAGHDQKVKERMIELLDHDDSGFALHAADVLANVDPTNEKLLTRISEWATSKSQPTVFAALDLLARSESSANAPRIGKLIELLKTTDWGLNVYKEVEVLPTEPGDMPEPKTRTVRRFAREQAIMLLGEYGEQATDALDILGQETDSDIGAISAAAEAAVSDIINDSGPNGSGGFF